LELFAAQPGLQRVYVPIGMGSGAAGLVAARDALGLSTQIIGVVSAGAPAFARAFASGHIEPAEVRTVLADGMACRTPHPEALARLRAGLARVVCVSDDEVAQAIRWVFESTHNVAEGAGAAALAAVRQEAAQLGGLQVAAILSGGNIDRPLLAQVLGDAPAEAPADAPADAPAGATADAPQQAPAATARPR
jgi:threonine dehydratase